MKKRLNIIDLDGTLITDDSLRLLAMQRMTHPMVALQVALRAMKLTDEAALHRYFFRRPLPPDQAEMFCQSLVALVNPQVLALIREHNSAQTLLLSASPDWYVKPFAAALGMLGAGSHDTAEGEFLYCKGAGKLALLAAKFPVSDYDYHLGIGDSEADKIWLAHCARPYWVANGQLAPYKP
jgi:phosphoserine phosphatase